MDDKNEQIQYNEGNVNDDVKEDVVVEKINKDDFELITVPDCTHSKVSRRPAEDIPGCTEVSCNNCPLGWFVRG